MNFLARFIERSVFRGTNNPDMMRELFSFFLIHSPSAFCAPWRVFFSEQACRL
jgi:hypothetical protein